MYFNAIDSGPRPLGNLQKPGAGVVMVPMSVPPEGEIPLLNELVAMADAASFAVNGGPDFIANPGMIHEYNLMGQAPGFVMGSYNPVAYELGRANKLAAIAELLRVAWGDLVAFLADAQNAVSYALQDALEAQTPGGKERALMVLRYYVDELTAVGPQIKVIAARLDLGGKIVEEQIRASVVGYQQASASLAALLNSAANLVGALAKQFREAAEAVKTPMKWATVAIAGIAVVALVGAAVYFVPRPRRR